MPCSWVHGMNVSHILTCINICCQRAVAVCVTLQAASLQTSWNSLGLLFEMHLKLCAILAHLNLKGLPALNITCWVVFSWVRCKRLKVTYFFLSSSGAWQQSKECSAITRSCCEGGCSAPHRGQSWTRCCRFKRWLWLSLHYYLLLVFTRTAVLFCVVKKELSQWLFYSSDITVFYIWACPLVLINARCLCSVPEEMGKPGSDAGMPGIEDSEVGKIDDAQFGNAKLLKWP